MSKLPWVLGLTVLLLSACGREAPPAAEGTSKPARPGKSLDPVEFAASNNDAQHLMLVHSTAELFWPKVGFTKPAEITTTSDTIPAVVSGEAWVAQVDTNLFWAAVDKGVDLVMVGVDKDNEVRILGSRPGLKKVEDLKPGMTISGGDIGDHDEFVLREILGELGVDPNRMNLVSFGGGADARMQALISGQLDVGIQQPRNVGPLTRAGGAILYESAAPMPQEVWIVMRNVWTNHRDAVCAFVEGRIRGKQWAAQGSDMRANMDTALKIVRRHRIDPTEDELADWERELRGNQSLDGGAEEEGFDKLQQDLKTLRILSERFQWRDHVDFSCVWEAQRKLGLPTRPEQRK